MRELDKIRKALKEMTPGPLAWGFASNDGNGYIIGAGCTLDDEPVSGFVDTDNITDEFLCKSVVGEHEAATCNYADPDAIVLSVNLAPALVRVAEAAEALSAHPVLKGSGPLMELDVALSALREAAGGAK